ncbi:DsbA family oxidoreductase [Alloiococcus sp. CFN-8]|uniref:DsbA family oxidoreductase n=1 Tax=Alloiococcus sp. CFN-8 TaxID=3416081 RepID=UPI003CEC597D
MKVEIWTDFVCPYCYIGKRMFQEALKKFDHSEDVEVTYRSFELNHNAPKGRSLDPIGELAEKYNMSREEVAKRKQPIIDRANSVGLDYKAENLTSNNTFDAHRLSQYAKTIDKMDKLTERIFKAQFIEGLDISNHEVLLYLAEEAGLNRSEAKKILESDAFSNEVFEDQKKADSIDLDYVPFFLFNDTTSVSGDYTIDTFLDTMNAIWNNEEITATSLDAKEIKKAPPGVVCEDGVCRLVLDDDN